MKACIRCGEEKILTAFPSERSSWCKECHRKYSSQMRRNRVINEGQQYLDEEAARVRRALSKEGAADIRRASERAKRAALRELRARHKKEYRELLRKARKKEGLE